MAPAGKRGGRASPALSFQRCELAWARVIVEPAERVDAHDRADCEQQDRALAAVVRVGPFLAAVQPHGGDEEQHRNRELDHAADTHSRLHLMSWPSRRSPKPMTLPDASR